MIGKPKFQLGDIVSFDITGENDVTHRVTGKITVVDKYGIFGRNDDVFYDVMVENWLGSNTSMFVKHIIESGITLES